MCLQGGGDGDNALGKQQNAGTEERVAASRPAECQTLLKKTYHVNCVFLCVYISVSKCVHMTVGASGSQKRAPDHLEQELQRVLSPLMCLSWVLCKSSKCLN